MRLLFKRDDNFSESFQVSGSGARNHSTFEAGKVSIDTSREGLASARQANDERAPVGFTDLAFDQTASRQSVENTRQGRPFVTEILVQFGYLGRGISCQRRQNVCLALG